MADYNKVTLVGRLTRNPEIKEFQNGGKLASFGFATSSGRKKNQSTGKYEGITCFLDVKAFNRGEKGVLANLVEQYLKKGSQVLIDGKLVMEEWNDQQGNNRSKIVVEVDELVFLDTGNKQNGGDTEQHESAPAKQQDMFVGENPFSK